MGVEPLTGANEMATRLYDIAASIRSLIDQTDSGELTAEVLEELERLELSLDEKTDAYCALVREAIAQQAAYTAEIDRLSAARATAANAERSLKERLTQAFQLAGIKRVDGPRFKAWLQRGQGSIEVTCLAEDLPTEFIRVTVTADKVKLADHLKANPDAVIAGVEKREGRESIRIK
jgi:Arc/MetJ family transcription regulator